MKTPKRISDAKYAGFKDLTKEWLEYQYVEINKTREEIAVMLDVHPDTIGNWLRKYHVKKKPVCQLGEGGPFKYVYGGLTKYDNVTREWLELQYITLNKSTNDILLEFGVSRCAFAKWLKKFGIKKSQETLGKNHSKRMSDENNPAWNGGTSLLWLKKKVVEKQPFCVWCGHKEDLQLHHIDHDTDNNDWDNLTILCGPCNRMESHLWALVQSGRLLVSWKDKDLILTF